jgi:two-component system, chemotaxis family, chemotaxis protein CheY
MAPRTLPAGETLHDRSGAALTGSLQVGCEPRQIALFRGPIMQALAAPRSRSAVAATILVVDDNEIMRHLLGRMLGRAGYEVVCAVDGEDGLARFRECAPDLVITDMDMPGLDGLGLIEALKRECGGAKVIAVSGVGSRSRYLRNAVRLGAKAALMKPVARAALVEAVEAAIAG